MDQTTKKHLSRLLKASAECINACRDHSNGQVHWCEGPAAQQMIDALWAISHYDAKAAEGERIRDRFTNTATRQLKEKVFIEQLSESEGGKILSRLGLRDVGCKLAGDTRYPHDACYVWVRNKPNFAHAQ